MVRDSECNSFITLCFLFLSLVLLLLLLLLLVVSSSVATFVGNGKSGKERVDAGDITAKVSNTLRVIILWFCFCC